MGPPSSRNQALPAAKYTSPLESKEPYAAKAPPKSVSLPADYGLNSDGNPIILQGYLMQRLGVGPAVAHYWEIRFAEFTAEEIKLYTNHTKDKSKSTFKVKPESCCMTFERECYAEGRWDDLFGVAGKGDPENPSLIFAPQSDLVLNLWLTALAKAGLRNAGETKATKRDPQSLREGFVWKKGTTWYRRYLVLLPNMLIYYKYKNDKSPAGVIPFTKTAIVYNGKVVTDKDTSFIVQSSAVVDKKYIFNAYDDNLSKMWLEAIRTRIAAVKSRA